MPDDREKAAKWIAETVSTLRSRYKTGVAQLIGVSPFLCNNLTPKYDHFQEGYATLLSSALRQYPGIAVLEIEEARAISQELQLNGEILGKRKGPLFVEAEYETKEKGDAEATVKVVLRVSDGKRVRLTETFNDLLLTTIGTQLSGPIARQIFPSRNGCKRNRLGLLNHQS